MTCRYVARDAKGGKVEYLRVSAHNMLKQRDLLTVVEKMDNLSSHWSKRRVVATAAVLAGCLP